MTKFNVRPDIDAAAERLSSTMGVKREIQRLPEVLWEGEHVDSLASGLYGGGNGLVVMTNLRLIFFKHGMMSQKVEDFPYGKISSVQWSGGMVMGTLTVFTSGNKAEIKNMPKDHGKAIGDKLRAHIAQGTAPAAPPAGPAGPTAAPQGIPERLAVLDQLLAAGAVTAEEHKERRAQILDSL